MSGSFVPIIAGSVAATAAAAARKKRMAEEENMTTYGKDDLDGWEFKIVRSNFGRFRKSSVMQRVCQEEAAAGWELLEKFDDHRLRFKRRVEKRSVDPHIDNDPYRSQVGARGGRAASVLIGLALLGLGLFLALGFWFR